ncbi:MAG: hypothetical protein ABMA13_13625 [Chthoniobacteraceae bacterium]
MGPIASLARRLFRGAERRPDFSTLAAARRVVLGSGYRDEAGWVCTDRDILDVTDRAAFARYWQPGTIDAFFAEHVWEHLPADAAARAVANCHDFLRPGGTLRIAVPDGLNPDPAYREYVRPGGSGPGADDHQVLYDFRSLAKLLADAGFAVELQEYWAEAGEFQHRDWTDERGHILRSRRYDPRNQDGKLAYTSLIADGIKHA